ncbi:MAG TPA: hypothetical protein ENH10_01465, partial [Bacteroidetes bacterium]|nr:hypothetical protein [Bacteroidota bacterium]HEX03814.1 hypothetical protein [Bacteroidota bacterium]
MDKNSSSSKYTSRIQLSQEAIPELLKLPEIDAGVINKACEWWVGSENSQRKLPEEFAYVVTQLDEYMRWRTSLQGRLHESSAGYRADGKIRSPFQQFLREREAFVPEYPRDTRPRLEHGIRSLIGESRIWREVVSMVQVAAFSSVPTLICGEVGSGKATVARVIHEAGNRSNRPYLPISCNYLSHESFRNQIREMVAEHGHPSDQMILKEMFCPFGTIYLSDIDQLPMPLQPLVVEQVRERYKPNLIDSSADSPPRILVSSSCDLNLLARQQLFRHDLFLEVAILQIDLPSLRQRRE